jgi:CHAT domain-containing protein/tetratricopeptide (TPR) repeat protein
LNEHIYSILKKLHIILKGMAWSFFVLLLLIFMLPFYAYSQESADELIDLGDALFLKKEYEKAIEFYTPITKGIPASSITLLNAYLKIGNARAKQKDYEEAKNNYTKGILRAENLEYSDSLITAKLHHKKGISLFFLKELENAISHYEKSLKIKKKLLDKNDMSISLSLFNMGYCYRDLGNLDNAIKCHLKSLKIRQKNDNSKYIVKSYRELGKVYSKKGDFTKAEEYYHYVLNEQYELYGKDDFSNSVIYRDLGILYGNQNKYKKAISYYKAALKIYADYDDTEGDVAAVTFNIGKILSDQGKHEQALEKYNTSLQLNKKYFGEDSDEYLSNITNIGIHYYEQNDFNNALVFLTKADKIATELYGEKHPEKALSLLNLADTWQKSGKDKKATQAYITATNILLDIESEIISLNSFIYNIVQDKELLLLIIKGYAETLEKSNLKKSLSYYQLCIALTDQMRQSQTAEASKIFWSGKLLPIFEKGIKNCFTLFEQSKDATYIYLAFHFFEKSKNITLLESIKEQDALHFSGINLEVILELKNIEQKISTLETQKYNSTENNSELSKKILELRQQQQYMIDDLELHHPKYHQLKYGINIIEIKDIQNRINDDETIISYFLGKDNLYRITIEKDEVHFIQKNIQQDNIAEKAQGLLEGIYEYQFSETHTAELYESTSKKYAKNARELHRILLGNIDIKTDKIIFIPDGVLGYLPFEVLLTHDVENAANFRTHSYLVKEKIISYAYSATMHFDMMDKEIHPSENRVLAYAPQFHEQQLAKASDMNVRRSMRSGLSELVYNVAEVKSIKKIFKTQIQQGEFASKNHFLEHGESYPILHFATHGKMNDQHSSYSYLAFTHPENDSTDQHLLYVKDLYQMQLNAEMVVLSACETGIGKLQKGEGIISLSRGFSFAGAKSLVTTLWSVNDVQMSKIISLFYKNLGKKENKNTALSHAKREFIKSSPPQFAHPYYWSAPVLVGDVSPVELGSEFPWIWLGVGLIVLGLVIFSFRNKN